MFTNWNIAYCQRKLFSPNWSVDTPYPNHDPKRLLLINWQVILKWISNYKEPRICKNNLERMKSIAQPVQPNFKNDYTASVIKAVWYWLLQMSRARIRTKVTHKLPTDPLTEEPSYSNLISEKTVFSLMMLGQLDN